MQCTPICCTDDPCEVAHFIYVSQTACYAKDRAKAVYCIAKKFDCRCNPEIMCALIYALNDADERVRYAGAWGIRHQTSKHKCCCSDAVISALTCALSDCDRKVRCEAEKALNCCGISVVDCPTHTCCSTATCGNNGCGNNGCGNVGCGPATMTPAPAPAVEPKTEEAPAPVEKVEVKPTTNVEPEAYFPSRLKNTQSQKSRKGLSNLFGLRG